MGDRAPARLLAGLATAAAALTVTACVSAGQVPASAHVTLAAPALIVSGDPYAVTVTASSPGLRGTAHVDVLDGDTWQEAGSAPLVAGSSTVTLTAWRQDTLRARVTGPLTALSEPIIVFAAPDGRPIPTDWPGPDGAPLVAPGGSEAPSQRPVGRGGNPKVTPVPDDVWAAMQGVTYQAGCPVGRAHLRLVEVNYRGFDGYRHRGRMVVAASIATRVGKVFSALHDIDYPIRQMRLPEEFGKDAVRGASDYAMMAADNTSGFNCRYVVGKESRRVMSPHAYGTAVDINPFENPYESDAGVVPDAAWLEAGPGHPAVLRSASAPAVRAFTDLGATWGGTFGTLDYHHFEWR